MSEVAWWQQPISEEGLKRLHNIWATDFGGCPRELQLTVHGFTPLPPHWFAYRGTLIHDMAENIFNGKNPNIYPNDFPGVAPSIILDEVSPLRKNMQTWFDTTSIDLSEARSEVKYRYTFNDGFTLTRKIDLLTPEYNIDFKSKSGRSMVGKASVKSSRAGVALGHWCSREDDGLDRKNRIIYLGGEEPVEHPVFGKRATLEKDLDRIWGDDYPKLTEQRTMIKNGHLMYCQYSSLCGMCNMRHLCRGI